MQIVRARLKKFGYELTRLPDKNKTRPKRHQGILSDYHAYYHGIDFLCPADSFVGQWVLSGYTWDSNLVDLIMKFSKDKTEFVICEVGSNIGASIVPVIVKFPHFKYILIEPSPYFAEYLNHNLRTLSQDNIQIHNRLLSDMSGKCETLIENSTTGGRTQAGPFGVSQKYQFTTVTLDDLIGSTHIDFLKIDTDGFEYPILRGAKKLIRRCLPLLWVEFTPDFLLEGGEDPEEFLTWLVNFGYDQLHVFNNVGEPLGAMSVQDTITIANSKPNGADYVDLLLLPK
jgi:FkbM family methyltransferase